MTNDTMNVNADEIDSLLKDIYDYLKRRENKALTDEDRKIAEALIDRSKKQLQKIAVLKSNEDDYYDDIDSKPNLSKPSSLPLIERYVDMNRSSTVDVPPPLPNKPVISPKPLELVTQCPYKEFPAKQVSNETKHGTLLIRRKVFNIIDRSSKAFGAVHDNWLLMYWSSKDSKPFCLLDLKQYEAREDESNSNNVEFEVSKEGSFRKNNTKLAASFTVFQAKSPEKKSYTFIATTHKDMRQWVVNINRSHDKAVRGDKELDYEICDKPPPDIEEENIYIEIGMESNKIPLPAIPERSSEVSPSPAVLSESTDDIYQQIRGDKNGSMESLDSFDVSEPEEDETYYELSTIRNEVKELKLKEPCNVENVPPPLPPAITKPVDVPTSRPLEDIEKTEPPKTEMVKPELPVKNIANNVAKPNPNILKRNPSKSVVSSNNTSSDLSKKSHISPKPSQTSSIVKINRQRFSTMEPQSPNMETFSNRWKLETFQATPTKGGQATDLDVMASSATEIDSALKSIDSLELDKPAQKNDDNEKPMVLLKDGLDEAKSSKKFKKSPLIFAKPKKCSSKLQL